MSEPQSWQQAYIEAREEIGVLRNELKKKHPDLVTERNKAMFWGGLIGYALGLIFGLWLFIILIVVGFISAVVWDEYKHK